MNTLGHVNVRTERLEETLVFYESVLGLTRAVAATNPDPTQNVWLVDAGGLACVHVNRFRPGEEVPERNLSCLHHIAFNCDDRVAMAARLERLALAYTVVETRVPGMVQFNLADPNGVRVELTFGHELARAARAG